MENKRNSAGQIFWLTGLPGAGKTTLARRVTEELSSRGRAVECLDGDALRKLVPGTGFTRDAREHYLRHVAVTAAALERHGVVVVASLVSPYRSSRDFARSIATHFTEIYISTPLEVCERRDPKGLYRQARVGQISNFTGIGDPYEIPEHPELSLDTSKIAVDEAVARILGLLRTT